MPRTYVAVDPPVRAKVTGDSVYVCGAYEKQITRRRRLICWQIDSCRVWQRSPLTRCWGEMNRERNEGLMGPLCLAPSLNGLQFYHSCFFLNLF